MKDKYSAALDDVMKAAHHSDGSGFEYGWQIPPGTRDRQVGDDFEEVDIDMPPVNFTESNPVLDQWFRDVGAKIRFAGHGPRYSHPDDEIIYPAWDQFVHPETYYLSLSHEYTHWTGAKPRLNRPWPFGSMEYEKGMALYAREECVAELGSLFWIVQMDQPILIHHHAAYLKNWMRGRRADWFQDEVPPIPAHWVREVAAPRAIAALGYLNQCRAINLAKVG